MSKIENFIVKIKSKIAEMQEAERVEEMRSHPHFKRCDGTGKIIVLERVQTPFQHPFVAQYDGFLTQCTSCKATQGTGLLRGKGFFDNLE